MKTTNFSRTINQRRGMILIPILAVGLLAASVQADKPMAKVKGRGMVTLQAAADDVAFGAFVKDDVFADNDFEIKVTVRADGSASGVADFFFGEAFSSLWGADFVTLTCEIFAATVQDDGTILLTGSSFEQDFADGDVIFEEVTPFEIVAAPDGLFTLRWCLLPAFDLAIDRGHLRAK